MNDVEVLTGARLHFGLICGGPQSSQRFGGIGLMIRSPGWRLSAEISDDFQCSAESADVVRRVSALLPHVCQLSKLSGMHVRVHDAIPLHYGLGSGTQLTLAVASAALILAGLPRPAGSLSLAAQLNRVRRSAVGAFGFDRGGLIVDRGQSAEDDSRQLTSHELPEPWRVVLLIPGGTPGLSGPQEESVFQERRFMTDATVAEQMELIEHRIVPAAQTADFTAFRNGLGEFGRNAGRFFAPQQGGVYSSPVIQQLAASREFEELQPAQSSWGPAAAVFARSSSEAQDITESITRSSFAEHLTCLIAEPLNCGASVRTTAPEVSDHVVRG